MARLMIFSRRPRARMRSEQAEWNIMIGWAVWICGTIACLIATIGTGGIEAWEHINDPPVAVPRNAWLHRKRCVCTATARMLTVAESFA